LGLTVEELGALGVAVLHLLTLVGGRLHVAVRGGEHRRPRLHQELADLDVVTGGGAVEGGPGDEGGIQSEEEEEEEEEEDVVFTHQPSLSAALALTPN